MKVNGSLRGLLSLWILTGFVFTDTTLPTTLAYTTSSFSRYENSIIISTLNTAGNILFVPGTPYDANVSNSQYSVQTKDSNRTRFLSIDIDYHNRTVYCFDENTAAIYALPFDWETNFENMFFKIVHVGVSASLSVRIAIDWISGNLYWTDPTYAWIAIQKVNGNDEFKILVKDKLKRPEAIAVDPIYKYIFWSDIGTNYAKIERASLAGNNRIVIISRNLINPSSFVIDQQTHRLIWIDDGRETIEMANYDGRGRKIIRRLVNSLLFDITLFRDIVCVTDLASKTAHFINKLTGEIIDGLIGKEELLAISIYSIDIQPTTGHNPCNSRSCNHICVNEGKNATCLCKEGYSLDKDGITCSEDLGKFHRAFVQSNRTHICLMDIRRFTAGYTNITECILTSGSDINAFDIAMQARRLFVADGNTIYSVNSLVPPTSTEHILSAPSTVTDVALNWRDNTLYWTMGDVNSGIYMVSLTTRSENPVINEDIDKPRSLVVQPFNNNIIWVSGTSGGYRIELARLTGSGRMTIITSKSLFGPTSLVVDANTNTLYFSDGHMKQCNLDGSDIKTLFPGLSPNLVLVYKQYLIVDESGYPFGTMTTFDKHLGTWIYSLKDSVKDVTSMKVLDEVLQKQQPGSCDVLNGGCEHICISNYDKKTCECDFGFIMQADSASCSSEPLTGEFLVVTDWTHNRIYQVSMETDDVHAIDTDTFGKPIGVVYDQIKNSVFWSTQRYLNSFQLNTSHQTELLDTGISGFSIERLALDYTSSNVYCTASNLQSSGKIIVVTRTGRRKTIKTVAGKPKAIALDPEDGLLFWSEINRYIASKVMKSNMDGSEPKYISSKSQGLVLPDGIAVDTNVNMLYIADGSTDIIHRCSYLGNCFKYYEDTGAQLMDIQVAGNYLYYTALNRLYITKLHRVSPNIKTMIAAKSELGRLDSLSIHSTTFVPSVSEACSANNGLGPCSTLCLPRPNGCICACEDGVKLLNDEYTCENAKTDFESVSRTHYSTTPSLSSIPSIEQGISTPVPTALTPFINVSSIVVAVCVCVVFLVAGLVSYHFIRRRNRRRRMDPSSGNQGRSHTDGIFSISGDQQGRAQRRKQRTTCTYNAASDLIQFENLPHESTIVKSVYHDELNSRDDMNMYEKIDERLSSLSTSESYVRYLDMAPVNSNINISSSQEAIYVTPS